MAPARILIVRLPCHKVFPTGPVYLLSAIHRAAPNAALRLLDLAVIQRRGHSRAIEDACAQFRPDVIAFSLRDIQIFSPQDMDGAMRDAFVFFHDPSIVRKSAAAFRGLWDIIAYRSSLAHNMGLVRRTAARHPSADVALGGSSIKIFEDRLRRHLPAAVRTYARDDVQEFLSHLGLALPPSPMEPDIDFDTLEAAFPQWQEYREETIGVQTKLGCPHGCLFCLYGFIEGKTVRRREPARVVRELQEYARRWGAKKFWFADAQLLSGGGDRDHLAAILEGIIAARLAIQWSGYLRIHEIDAPLASLMVRSGLCDLELSLSSGATAVLEELKLGFTMEQVMRGCEILAEAGYAGRVIVNLALNSPGETRETLRQTIAAVRRIKGIFAPLRVVPVVFFLAIQPHTGLESRAIADGHIRAGYDPLSVLPWDVIRLIYNPPPLGRMIGRACAAAFQRGGDEAGDMVLAALEAGL
ncbi:MAG: radical SAM protein [Spirochaetia bacterium]